MNRKTKRDLIFVACMWSAAVALNRNLNRRVKARQAAQDEWFAEHTKTHQRTMKELEALDSDLQDRIDRGKFWLIVTDPDNQD